MVMRKFIAIFFVSLYLIAFTEAKQVLKLPDLVEHFVAHKLKDHSTTLYSFIKMHYLDAPVKDADYKQDMKLPFKTITYVSGPVFMVNSQKIPEIPAIISIAKSLQKTNFFYTEPFTDSALSPVFRPPVLG